MSGEIITIIGVGVALAGLLVGLFAWLWTSNWQIVPGGTRNG